MRAISKFEEMWCFRDTTCNPVAAMEAFASDGWFRTGDLATLEASGHFLLAGRSKGFVNINSVKFETADVRMAGHLQPSSAHQAWHAAA